MGTKQEIGLQNLMLMNKIIHIEHDKGPSTEAAVFSVHDPFLVQCISHIVASIMILRNNTFPNLPIFKRASSVFLLKSI